mmetsp:Transcript_13344/g.27997  ORF Transcript_13344/g.27997 Transcript_13344/m.27997 type:complete len:250 (-) Transcript_13344:238-987(-)
MILRVLLIVAALLVVDNNKQMDCHAFSATSSSAKTTPSKSILYMSTSETESRPAKEERYVPKWKKKATLAETIGQDLDPQDKGLVGSVPITFQQGEGENATRIETTAIPGQSLKLVASQAGQFIKYGCGKGECGTCEALCNGKYLRPCIDSVPVDLIPDATTGEYSPLVIQVKGTRAKVVSSGKFFSVKSFILGFWNNLLGMAGFVRDRRAARKNWEERMKNEEDILKLTMEKKRRKREAAERAATENK